MQISDLLKQSVNLVQHIELRTGQHFRKEGNSLYMQCPFCQSKKGLRVSLAKPNLFNCFGDGCGAKSTVIDFEIRFQNCDKRQAIQWLAQEYHLMESSRAKESPMRNDGLLAKESSMNSIRNNSLLAKKIWENAIPLGLEQAQEILLRRGFGNLANGDAAKALTTIAKVHQYKDNEWLVLPYFEEKSGDVVGIHRILFSDLKTKRDLGDKRGLLVEGRDSKPCIIVESLANGLGLNAIGYPMLMTGGTENKKAIIDKIERAKANGRKVLIWLDRGAESTQEMYCREFEIEGIWFEESRQIRFDVNDLLKESDTDFASKVEKYIAQANGKCLFTTKPKAKDKQNQTENQESGWIGKKSQEQARELPEWLEISKDGKPKVIPGIAADCYFQEQQGNLIYTFQSFWRYESGAWRTVEDKHIKAEIQSMIGKGLAKKFLVEDIVFQVSNLALQPREFEFNRNPWLLNFTNGVLDIKTSKFGEHNKEYYQTIQFSFSYTSAAKWPLWLVFLNSLEFREDTYSRIQEWGGYCLVPITPLQKCLFLKGEGDNGKSVLLETLSAMLGNVSTMEVHQLFEKFKVAELQGKLANICTDIQTTKIFSEEFKKIVSGEPVTAEKKFKDPFKFRPFAKLLFSANNFMPTKDRSHGFFRRFDILEFKKIFPKDKQDPFLKDKLQQELAGIFNWAYEGLQKLMANNWKLTDSQEMQQTMEEFKEASNPLQQFINERCEAKPNGWIDTKGFRKEYEAWCKEMGYEVLADNKLGQEMKRLGFGKARHQEGKQRPWVYTGLILKRI